MNFWNNLSKPFTALAPMEGVTDVVFRELISSIAKPDVFYTEFTNVEAVLTDNKFAHRSLMFTKNQHPIIAQIWGVNPEKFYSASQIIAKLGFDGIDINLGCPVHDVVKKGACSAMIGKNQIVSEIIAATRQAGLPVSIKTRLGYDKIITEDWFNFLLSQKLAAIAIHGRTAKQKSQGQANWEEIAKVVKLRDQISKDTFIIGNGDVKSYAEVLEKSQTFSVDGVMIGRGVFDNPFIFSPTKTTPRTSELLQLFIYHLQLFDKFYGQTGHFDSLKKYCSIYIKDFPNAKNLRLSIMKSPDLISTQKILSDFTTSQSVIL